MKNVDLDRLLGSAHVDPGYDEFLTHMSNCAACREDMEGLLAALQEQRGERAR